MSLVYIVDDSRAILSFFKSLLLDIEAEVKTFADPAVALENVTTDNPDLILSDYEMPNMNGSEFCVALRKIDSLKSCPIIVLSTHDNDSYIIECLKAGADDYLPKRTNPEVLQAKMKLHLELKKHRDSTINNERLKTYSATLVSLNHEINNVSQVLLNLLSDEFLGTGEGLPDTFMKKREVFLRNLHRLLAKIKSYEKMEKIEFEYYLEGSDSLILKKVD